MKRSRRRSDKSGLYRRRSDKGGYNPSVIGVLLKDFDACTYAE